MRNYYNGYVVYNKMFMMCLLWTLVCNVAKGEKAILPGDSIFVDASVIGGVGDGSSWEDAFQSLQNGIQASVATDTVYVAEGIYYPDEGTGIIDNDRTAAFEMKDSVSLMGGFESNGTGIRDYVANPTILSGAIGIPDSTDNSFNVVRMVDVSAETFLDGFIVEEGNADGGGLYQNGGGLFHTASVSGDTSAPIIRNCTLRYNHAMTRGGGMYNNSMVMNATCLPTITNCYFIENVCDVFDGGAIFNGALNGGICKPIIDSCQFIDNQANAAGAIHVFATAEGECSPTITNCMFAGNISASNGGAIHTVVFEGNSYPEIHKCHFSGNVAQKNGGALHSYAATAGYEILATVDSCSFLSNVALTEGAGAVMNWAEAGSVSLIMTSCSFIKNQSSGSAGALMNFTITGTSKNNSVFRNCLFSENKGAYGGACEIFTADGMDASQFIQCLFEKDSAEYGAGLDVYLGGSGTCSPLVLNCVFSQNVASESGGGLSIFAESGTCQPLILNSIFWNNEAADGSAGIATFDALSIVDYCLVDTNNCAGLGENGQICGTNMIYDEDPKFEDPSNGDYALKAGSPCIDQGQNNKIVSLAVTEDFEANTRIFNDIVDLGILESDGMPSFCDDTIQLLSISIPNGLYHANLKLIASGQLESMALTEFKANNCIDLLAGFEVAAGSTLEASIEDCQVQASSRARTLIGPQREIASFKRNGKAIDEAKGTLERKRRPNPVSFER